MRSQDWSRPSGYGSARWVVEAAQRIGVSDEHVEEIRRDMRTYAAQLIEMGYRPEDVRYSYVHEIGGSKGNRFILNVTVRAGAPVTRLPVRR